MYKMFKIYKMYKIYKIYCTFIKDIVNQIQFLYIALNEKIKKREVIKAENLHV